ncbi:hypothetical protein HR060_07485 [Catenovulum sp. SM1970]|uniref:pilus assembly protein n=1 Tax=Marinifaba aquimaris TaxID=2741323 RepID=UPI00157269B3|nr:PilC/PilY family type IV pilus protein [Marinifaba aquimaris]NTS76709.1 hypothetical protein [Marinifaba aquimaris]
MKKIVSALACLACAPSSVAEDIELYVNSNTSGAGSPQIMIIFDNSGSMKNHAEVKAGYDPTINYENNQSGFYTNRATYFVTGAIIDGVNIPVPEEEDKKSKPRRFERSNNACDESRIPLYGLWKHKVSGAELVGDDIESLGQSFADYELIEGGQGYFIDPIVQYKKDAWIEIKEDNGLNANDVVDCKRDVDEANTNNFSVVGSGGNAVDLAGFPGLPVDGLKDKGDAIYHLSPSDTQYSVAAADFGSVEVTTLYTVNYLNWYHSTTVGTTTKSRLEVAKETISNLVQASSADIEYGLSFFNERAGGRIVNAIAPDNVAANINAEAILENIEDVNADTWTPLCETLSEVYRYYAGLGVHYGDNDPDKVPARDLQAEVTGGGTYKTPLNEGCRDQIYTIIITDGEPTKDGGANSVVTSLGGDTSKIVDGSYLPVLADWMFNNDINTSLPGKQTAVTFTIGFGEDAVSDAGQILSKTAEYGGGKYYPATSASQLTTALQNTIIQILQTSATFTSPSIAANNFDRTRSLDSVYFSMFLPSQTSGWRGNLKKLKVSGSEIVDQSGGGAINALGNIDSDAQTFWGATSNCSGSNSCADGNEVDKGGVAEMLAETSVSARTLYSDIGASGGLDTFNYSKLNSYFADLATEMGIAAGSEEQVVRWAMGYDEYDLDKDNTTDETREDLFADPLHSKPLVLNYGGSSSSQDIRILVGTNAGVLHMFQDKESSNTVEESWAFYPKAFVGNYARLPEVGNKLYGMDGSPIAFTFDKNFDGSLKSSDGDLVYMYTGLRRGGRDYYALNLSNPDSPTKMWQIQGGQGDFTELAQTWSQPVIGFINHKSHDNTKPVVIFSAGYNGDSDITASTSQPGRGLFIVDGTTGELIWKTTPSGSSSTNTQNSFRYAMPARPVTLDSDGDGYIDRIYAADIGGYVWRIDMPGNDPKSATTPWTVQQLADLSSSSGYRKFFSEPSLVRTYFTEVKEVTIDSGTTTEKVISQREVPYDGVLIGSGDRAHPNSTADNDAFFLIQDRDVMTRSYDPDEAPAVITETELYDFTGSPFIQNTASQMQTKLIDLGSKLGWKIDFQGSGEKAMSGAKVIEGVVYFTSFIPSSNSSTNTCELNAGEGKLYAVSLHYGMNIYGWESKSLGERVPDTPVLFGGEDTDGSGNLLLIGVGTGDNNSGTLELKAAVDPVTCEDLNNCQQTEAADFDTEKTKRSYLILDEEGI